ncbi:hypothetical protein MSMEG_5293 [Mycolicibacterium smegmatis MC2 155]|uniref:Uncharacterized protein n=1 Tax=Mycolicibacterium smegmatis (strain ATCC 700084 / mc(2)155) TaxID=246196 RepID=A0R301_MYCS2|nr:hypothetical protein MSMEG_5293 [Mycolicibacterium smegmatis MC2 155]
MAAVRGSRPQHRQRPDQHRHQSDGVGVAELPALSTG